MPHILENRDICNEIVHYFNVSLEDDKPNDIKTKQCVLRSLALTTRKLTDVALDELWKSMTTLEPIVEVFNGAATSGVASTNASLSYNNNLEYWETRLPANDNMPEPFPRVLSYLSRIRCLHFSFFPPHREYNLWHCLWQSLSSLGWLTPLCPNLRNLSLGVDCTAQTAYNIVPFISPTIRHVDLHCSESPTDWAGSESSGEAVASIILDLLKARNVEVASISFRGFTSYRIIQRILAFPNLLSVVLPLAGRPLVTVDQIIRFFDMRKLTVLDIHLGLYDTTDIVGSWLDVLKSLGRLTLRGPLITIIQCLREPSPIVSVHSLALLLDASSNGNMDPLIRQISMLFPRVRNLTLEAITHGHIDLLSVTQILLLQERPLEALALRRCLNINPEQDLGSIVLAWPTLRSLHIEGPDGLAVADEILPFISRRASFLSDVTLPVDPSSLTRISQSSLITGDCVCPLQRLNFVNSPLDLPAFNKASILSSAHNLITLFPRINTVTAPGTGEPDILHDVQTVIEAMQLVLASPPTRPDRLFQQ